MVMFYPDGEEVSLNDENAKAVLLGDVHGIVLQVWEDGSEYHGVGVSSGGLRAPLVSRGWHRIIY